LQASGLTSQGSEDVAVSVLPSFICFSPSLYERMDRQYSVANTDCNVPWTSEVTWNKVQLLLGSEFERTGQTV